MPTPAAREAFAEAQEHSSRMHGIHAEELQLHEQLNSSADPLVSTALQLRMAQIRREWLELSDKYSAAMARFGDEVARKRAELLKQKQARGA